MDGKELENRYRLLKDLMDNIPDVIYFKDKKGRLVMVNQAYARGLGIKPELAIGKTDFDIFPKERAQKMWQDDLRVMTSGKPLVDKIERATRADGVDNFVSTTKIPRYDAKGKVIGLVGITRDITHRMQVRYLEEDQERIRKKIESLKEVNYLKSDFVSTVSHELRTPLAIIKDAVGLIADGTAGAISPQQKKIITNASNNILRLQHIVDQLLDISRIESGKLKLHYSLVKLNDLVSDSAQYFQKISQDKAISLNYELPKTQINIFIDAERIVQVMNNLISNAIKFTEEEGTIKVGLLNQRENILFWVKDNGIGIAQSDLAKLFHKFVQVSSFPDAHKKGLGLGLAIARELIGRHGGRIWAESKLGVGSSFYFSLPRFYAIGMLEKNIRNKINRLLNTATTVYLINLFVVHFLQVPRKIKINRVKLISDLRDIIEAVFKSLSGRRQHGFEIVGVDAKRGECKIILAEATEKKVAEICTLLKEKIKGYFSQNKIENCFVNIGNLPYVSDYSRQIIPDDTANLYVKNIHIGLEKRSHQRFYYQAEIEVCFSDAQRELARSVDISLGGLYFLSSKAIKPDKMIRLKLKVPTLRNSLDILGRVAWVKRGDRFPDKKYKVGIEFITFKNRDKMALRRFINSTLKRRMKG